MNESMKNLLIKMFKGITVESLDDKKVSKAVFNQIFPLVSTTNKDKNKSHRLDREPVQQRMSKVISEFLKKDLDTITYSIVHKKDPTGREKGWASSPPHKWGF